MGMLKKSLIVAVVGVVAWFAFSGKPPTIPHFDPEAWWGPNELKGKLDQSIRPFKVKFEESMIKDLKYRLKNHRPFNPPLEGVAFEYGFNTGQLDSWLTYWREKYNFTEREAFLNQFPHYKTYIQGLDLHFIRVKPEVPENVEVVPLLLLHGWPGSIRELYKAIPLLASHRPGYKFAFEVIAPSIPGFGFSQAAVRPGFGVPEMAVVYKNLMTRLGYDKFYIQGGDWGASIGDVMVTLYPDAVLGYHSNMILTQHSSANLWMLIGAFMPSLVVEDHLADRMYPLSKIFAVMMEEFGYMHLHATKPETVGVALTDSPAGLMAYTFQAFSCFTRPDHKHKVDGGLEYRFTKDDLLDVVMVYWSTNSISTAIRIYAESLGSRVKAFGLDEIPTPVPTWGLQSKYEAFYMAPSLLRYKFTNLINTTALDDGGHFMAFELPEIFTEDVYRAVQAFKEWHQKNK
ncbi:unnamed protein product [Chrysodeixis includens]|uniref:Epoxide hydrolase n=1 Tax=Chrysodeixis includens TaxID=689277 RepID=A0A9P0C0M1_CHRIL|nr:unnamed protein product [Chrysodeixis includens]